MLVKEPKQSDYTIPKLIRELKLGVAYHAQRRDYTIPKLIRELKLIRRYY